MSALEIIAVALRSKTVLSLLSIILLQVAGVVGWSLTADAATIYAAAAASVVMSVVGFWARARAQGPLFSPHNMAALLDLVEELKTTIAELRSESSRPRLQAHTPETNTLTPLGAAVRAAVVAVPNVPNVANVAAAATAAAASRGFVPRE